MTKYDAEWRRQALEECWKQQMTPLEFAQYVGITRAQVYAIFAGREWKSIPRPEGFVYPFPAKAIRKEEETRWRTECLSDYVREKMSTKQFAAHLGVTVNNALYVLRGEGWRDIPRPEGFRHPWPKG